MKYQEVEPISRSDAEIAFSSGSPETIREALLGVTFYDPDWRWVQDTCLEYVQQPEISSLAITCLGHLARRHGNLDLERVLPILQELRSDPKLAGTVDDVLDDIQMFILHGDKPS